MKLAGQICKYASRRKKRGEKKRHHKAWSKNIRQALKKGAWDIIPRTDNFYKGWAG
jgi:hypothetical protein